MNMNKLIVDCSYGMSLFLVDKNDVVYSKVDLNQKKHTDELLLQLDELLNSANLEIGDIDVLGVCVGPGSFTGVRVAISICKGLAIGSNIKVIVMSNFDVYECGVEEFVLVLEGFSSFVYTRKYVNGQPLDLCEDINDFSRKYIEASNKTHVYVNTEKVQNMLKMREINANIALYNAILCLNKKIKNNDFIDINKIEPIYLRASQAEIERNKKLNGVNNG